MRRVGLRPELGRFGCRMAHGPVAGGGAIILAHEQSSRAAGMIDLETGQVKSYGAQDEKELLVNPPLLLCTALPTALMLKVHGALDNEAHVPGDD